MTQKNRDEKVLIAGSGGQGIMFLGLLIAQAAVRENKCTTLLKSYGAEMRGGTAQAAVCLSEREIASPYIDKPTILIAMNAPSLDKFLPRVEPHGVVVANSSLADIKAIKKKISRGIHLLAEPLTDIALQLGSEKVANILALALLLTCRPIVNRTTCKEVFQEYLHTRKEVLKKNRAAIDFFTGRKSERKP